MGIFENYEDFFREEPETYIEDLQEFLIEFRWFFPNNPINIITMKKGFFAHSISNAYYKIRQSYPNVKIKMHTKAGKFFWS